MSEMDVTITRFASGPKCTLGVLEVWGDGPLALFRCFTIERPWLDNRPGVSCIPEGQYPVSAGTFFNNTESPDDDYPCLVVGNVPGRTNIKIHAGNKASHSHGCPLVGKYVTCLDGVPAVVSSRDTLRELLRVFRGPGTLHVRSETGGL